MTFVPFVPGMEGPITRPIFFSKQYKRAESHRDGQDPSQRLDRFESNEIHHSGAGISQDHPGCGGEIFSANFVPLHQALTNRLNISFKLLNLHKSFS